MQHDEDHSDEEPDFTDPNRECNDSAAPSEAKAAAECSNRLLRKYDPKDLHSVETDPSCKENWFLAAYWPVYVGNFKVDEWARDTWYEQVSNYFAYNGLLTRMIYVHVRTDDKQFWAYQNQCMLIDMLVYFASKADADRAMATCHRDSYYGYKLNVLPGRDPLFFDNERSVQFVELGNSCLHTPLETVMEKLLSRHGPVSFAGRYPSETVILEFVSTPAMLDAVASQFTWKPAPMSQQVMKQRFVEGDVKLHLEWAKESNPAFMDMQPKASVLIQLFEGIRPDVSTSWQGRSTYLRAPTLKKRRQEKDAWAREKIFMKRNRIEQPGKPETEVVTRDPPLPPQKTKRQKDAEIIEAVNRFLRSYGAAPITRASVRDVRMKVEKRMQGK